MSSASSSNSAKLDLHDFVLLIVFKISCVRRVDEEREKKRLVWIVLRVLVQIARKLRQRSNGTDGRILANSRSKSARQKLKID